MDYSDFMIFLKIRHHLIKMELSSVSLQGIGSAQAAAATMSPAAHFSGS